MNERGLFYGEGGEPAASRLFDNATAVGSIVNGLVRRVNEGHLREELCIEAVREVEAGTFEPKKWLSVLSGQEQ
jgi:hypothetical protein